MLFQLRTSAISTLLLLSFCSLTRAQNLPTYIPSNGLLAYYPLDSNGNDLSGNNNHLSAKGNLTYTKNKKGMANKAAYFPNGNDYFLAPSSTWSLINNLPKGTVSFWVNIDSQYVSGHYFGIGNSFLVKQEHGVGQDLFFGMLDGTTKIRMQITGVFPSASGTDVIGKTSLTPNTWYHVVGVWNGTNHTLYINGVQDGQIINTSGIPNRPSPDHFSIGSVLYGGNGSNNYPSGAYGSMDEIGIWNRDLSANEIVSIFNARYCAKNLIIKPNATSFKVMDTASFKAQTSDQNPQFTWQSNFGQGFQDLFDYGNYSGSNSDSLTISNLSLRNHLQPIRVISISGNCIDTSAITTIKLRDTCINLISVQDTLVIKTILSTQQPPLEHTIRIYPNPARTQITIDYGNYSQLSGYSIKIFNNLSQTIFSSSISQQTSKIDLSTLTGKGLYFVQIVDPNNNVIHTRKILVQ